VIITLSQFVEAPIEHPNNAMTKMTKDIIIETQEISIIRQIQYNQMLNEIYSIYLAIAFYITKVSNHWAFCIAYSNIQSLLIHVHILY
jgi:hypothetical protein